MSPVLLFGIIIFFGLILGEIAVKCRLPKITGYLLAGILFNPHLFHIISRDIIQHANLVTDVSLSFITFSVGGTLLYPRLKALGKGILSITIFEAECAFLLVAAGMAFLAPMFLAHAPDATFLAFYLPFALLMGALASPTDPSATLAVVHEYKAQGDVSSTIMGVAALDDVTGIVNYSVAVVIAQALVLHQQFSVAAAVFKPLAVIGGAVALGVVFGFIFNFVMRVIRREGEGFLIVGVFATISLCYGTARLIGVEELLATMTMGVVVVNFNPQKDAIFRLLERYTEELIFVIFFTLSGMFLDFSALAAAALLVVFFVILRAAGKAAGTVTGAVLARSPENVRRYAAFGLIPQGGIVIGLALLIKSDPVFSGFSDLIVSIVIGTAVIQELIGPVLSLLAIRKAGEAGKAAA